MVSEWAGTKAQLQCNYSMSDIVADVNIPTLSDVNKVFGNSTSVRIIVEHISSVMRYAGLEINTGQLGETSLSILSNYYFLNLAELCLFFAQLKAGQRGQVIWGNRINNHAIMVALYEFSQERKRAITKKEEDDINAQSKKGFTRIEKKATEIVRGIESIKDLRKKAKTDIVAFRELFPYLPKEHTEKVIFEAYGGKEEAIREIYGEDHPSNVEKDIFSRLCDYNCKIKKNKQSWQ